MEDLDLSGIPEDKHGGIKTLHSILIPCGFRLSRNYTTGRFIVVPIEGRKYYHLFTKEPMSVEEAYSLYIYIIQTIHIASI